MSVERIRLVGDIHNESRLKDGQGVRVAREFLTILTKEFAKCAAKYMRVTQEAPFVYKERQLHSILAPAFSAFTSAFLMESPVQRKWSTTSGDSVDDTYGWVDYWCYYRNLSFLLELKHGFISTKSGQIQKSVKEEWKKAIAQLDAIEDEAKIQSEWTNGAIRIALHILPLFETRNKGEVKPLNQKNTLFAVQKQAMNELDRNPNWSAIWRLHKDLVGPYKYQNTTEYYPGVLFVAHVSEIIENKVTQ